MGTLADLIEPTKTAVLVVDVQNDYCHPSGTVARKGGDTTAAMAMIPTLRSLLDAARQFGAKVFFVQTVHTDDTDSPSRLRRTGGVSSDVCRKGTWGAEFTGVAPLPNEPVIEKHRYSGFIRSRLESVLHTYGIETLIVTGVATNVCVESTARDGYMLDYNIVLAADCCAALTLAEHDASVYNIGRYFGVASGTEEILATWQAYSRKSA